MNLELQKSFPVNLKSMFSSNTAEIINLNNKKKKTEDLFSKILFLHKKLKEVAQFETISKTKFKHASLNKEQIQKVKLLESNLSCFLMAFQCDNEIDENKQMILNRIHSLLDEYLSMCKPQTNKLQTNQKLDPKNPNTVADFNGFFEQ